jgi:hypothetical protein
VEPPARAAADSEKAVVRADAPPRVPETFGALLASALRLGE